MYYNTYSSIMLPVFFCASIIKHLELVRPVHLGKINYVPIDETKRRSYLPNALLYISVTNPRKIQNHENFQQINNIYHDNDKTVNLYTCPK